MGPPLEIMAGRPDNTWREPSLPHWHLYQDLPRECKTISRTNGCESILCHSWHCKRGCPQAAAVEAGPQNQPLWRQPSPSSPLRDWEGPPKRWQAPPPQMPIAQQEQRSPRNGSSKQPVSPITGTSILPVSDKSKLEELFLYPLNYSIKKQKTKSRVNVITTERDTVSAEESIRERWRLWQTKACAQEPELDM